MYRYSDAIPIPEADHLNTEQTDAVLFSFVCSHMLDLDKTLKYWRNWWHVLVRYSNGQSSKQDIVYQPLIWNQASKSLVFKWSQISNAWYSDSHCIRLFVTEVWLGEESLCDVIIERPLASKNNLE